MIFFRVGSRGWFLFLMVVIVLRSVSCMRMPFWLLSVGLIFLWITSSLSVCSARLLVGSMSGFLRQVSQYGMPFFSLVDSLRSFV